jgi:hypothetical protein
MGRLSWSFASWIPWFLPNAPRGSIPPARRIDPALALAGPATAGIDSSALAELLATPRPVLLVQRSSTGGEQFRPRAILAGQMEDDGVITLLGSCGAAMSTRVEAVADSLGRKADASFWIAVATRGSPEATAMGRELNDVPSPAEVWLATDPSERSLYLPDIPLESSTPPHSSCPSFKF